MTPEEIECLVRAGAGRLSELRSVLQRVGTDTLYQELDGIPLISLFMIEACNELDTSALRTLLAAGLSPSFVLNPVHRHTLLMRAACVSPEVVQLLLSTGADPEMQDDKGWTALMYAVALDQTSGACSGSESARIVKMLLEAGAVVNRTNVDGCTARDILMLQREADASEVREIAALL